jgi:hypothetical protein
MKQQLARDPNLGSSMHVIASHEVAGP